MRKSFNDMIMKQIQYFGKNIYVLKIPWTLYFILHDI